MRKVIVHTKEGCHLCERVIVELKRLNVTNSFELSIQDITVDSQLFERYWNIIPVVSVDGVIKLTAESLPSPSGLESLLRNALSL